MKQRLLGWVLVMAIFAVAAPNGWAAEEQKQPAEPAEKPLGPGWLSLDCCVGPLDNGFDNPICRGDIFQVLIEAADPDPCRHIRREEGIRFEFSGALESVFRGLRRDVEQHDRISRVR